MIAEDSPNIINQPPAELAIPFDMENLDSAQIATNADKCKAYQRTILALAGDGPHDLPVVLGKQEKKHAHAATTRI